MLALGTPSGAHTGHFLKSSKLELQPEYLEFSNGSTVPVSFDPKTEPSSSSQAHVFPFPIMFAPVPLFGAFVNPAKEISIPAGTRFSVVTR
jgi:hypothetical protein